jgi:excisionase family DNA binding protein
MLQPSADVYQYKTMPFQSNALSEFELNHLGSQGWLLVSTLPTIVFVRRVAGSSPVTRTSDPMLLSIKQVSERLNISRSKVYGLIASGEIASIKVGRLTRVHRQELEVFARSMARG